MRPVWMCVLLTLTFGGMALAAAIDPETKDAKPMLSEGAEGYKLVFSDEFNGKSLDQDKWLYRTGARLLSFQKPQNVSVEDGYVRLALKREDAGGLKYTAGGIISKQNFTYGYFEARFRCPKTGGWHTSFWTMNYNTPGAARAQEIDICEQDSANNRSYSAGVIDWSGKTGKKSTNFGRKRFRDDVPDFAADFHVWGCEFTPKEVKFFLDGKLTHSTDATKFPHGAQQVWLTCVGALWGDPAKPKAMDDKALPAYADFDWVRVYQK